MGINIVLSIKVGGWVLIKSFKAAIYSHMSRSLIHLMRRQRIFMMHYARGRVCWSLYIRYHRFMLNVMLLLILHSIELRNRKVHIDELISRHLSLLDMFFYVLGWYLLNLVLYLLLFQVKNIHLRSWAPKPLMNKLRWVYNVKIITFPTCYILKG